MTATARRALVLGPPLVLGLLERGHPGVMPGTPIAATLAPIATWWTVLHVAQVPLFAPLGLAVWRLVHDLDGRAARISGGAVAVFVVIYPAFDAAVGVGSGVVLVALGPLSADGMAAIEPALRALFWGPVTGMMAIVGGGRGWWPCWPRPGRGAEPAHRGRSWRCSRPRACCSDSATSARSARSPAARFWSRRDGSSRPARGAGPHPSRDTLGPIPDVAPVRSA